MKKTIEIECPDGYKPVYNAETGKVEIVSEDIIARVQTYEDACKIMSRDVYGNVPANFSVDALRKLHVILDALNEGYKFNLLTGTVWYPWVRFFRMKSVPKDAEVIGHFSYQGEKFALVGGLATYGGGASSTVGMLACKSEEIAKYVSTQFGKLVFEACFARHFNVGEFKWLD